jgi:hypothetical protein
LVTANYEVQPGVQRQLYMKIEDPNRSVIWTDNDAKDGSFALTTLMAGDYAFCFLDMPTPGSTVPAGSKRRIDFDLRVGLGAKDYEDIAKKEHLEPLQLEFRKMEDLLDVLNGQLQYLRTRDFEARDTSEATNARVVWLSVLSTTVLVILGIVQIYSFYAYLKHKKVL